MKCLYLQKSHGYEKSAQCLDLAKFVRCQRNASKYGDYFEFTLFGEDNHKKTMFSNKSVNEKLF